MHSSLFSALIPRQYLYLISVLLENSPFFSLIVIGLRGANIIKETIITATTRIKSDICYLVEVVINIIITYSLIHPFYVFAAFGVDANSVAFFDKEWDVYLGAGL